MIINKVKRIANRDAREYVNKLIEFKGSNTFSKRTPNKYIVYSYGEHWPLFVFDISTNQWYGNNDKFSRTTSKHLSQLHPSDVVFYMTKNELQMLINN